MVVFPLVDAIEAEQEERGGGIQVLLAAAAAVGPAGGHPGRIGAWGGGEGQGQLLLAGVSAEDAPRPRAEVVGADGVRAGACGAVGVVAVPACPAAAARARRKGDPAGEVRLRHGAR